MTCVTFQSPRGATINICPAHQHRLHVDHAWPRDAAGEEYCTVSHGLHDGCCHYCEDEQGESLAEADAQAGIWE